MGWFETWFADEMYLEVYSHRDAAEARQAVDLLLGSILLPAGSLVLDLACGTGRHAFEFARSGCRVVAADLSMPLLTVARRKTQRFSGSLDLVRADMRRLPFRAAFDAVAQLFTAFGYFESDRENAAVINAVASVLVPRGWYMLDFLNADEVASHLRPYSEDFFPGGRIVQERRIQHGRIEKTIVIEDADHTRHFNESVRLYSRDELSDLFEEQGFSVERVYGDYSGGAHSAESPRCILIGRRRS